MSKDSKSSSFESANSLTSTESIAEDFPVPDSFSVKYQLSINIDKAEFTNLRMQQENNTSIVASFCGNSSKTKTIKSSLFPEWQEKLLISTFHPNALKKIEIRVMTFKIHEIEKVFDSFYLNFQKILKKELNWSWFYLYTDPLKSVYAGRVLLSASAYPEKNPVNSSFSSKKAEIPKTKKFLIWFEVLEVAGFGFNANIFIKLEIGLNALVTNTSVCENQRWFFDKQGLLPELIVEYPENQLPKVFIKAFSADDKENIGFISLQANKLVKKGSKPKPPSWKQFTKTKNLPYLGFCLFRINIASLGNLEYFRQSPYTIDYGMYELRALVYQAQGIKISDTKGSSDPVLTISANGVTKSTKIEKQCLNPQWNEVLAWRINLNNNLRLCNALQINLWDFQNSESLGFKKLKIFKIPNSTLSRPLWYDLKTCDQNKPKVLISFVLYKLTDRKQVIPFIDLSTVFSLNYCKLQVLVIGTRNMIKDFFGVERNVFVRICPMNKLPIETKAAVCDLKSLVHCNFFEILECDIEVHRNPEFAPCVIFKVIEKGDYDTEISLGAFSVNLGQYLPWITSKMKKDIKRKKFEQSENLEKNDKSIKKNHKNTNKNIKKEKTEDHQTQITEIFDTKDEKNQPDDKFLNLEEIKIEQSQKISKWPHYKPKEYFRTTILGSFEDHYGSQTPFETLLLSKLNLSNKPINSGSLRCSLKVSLKDEKSPLAETLFIIKSTSSIYARFYIYEILNLPQENSELYLWFWSKEGNEEHNYRNQLFSNKNSKIMTCYTIKVNFPEDSFYNLDLRQLNPKDELLGCYIFDLESRWFNKKYQEIKSSGVRNIPIETLTLKNSEKIEIKVCLELLNENEYKTTPSEMLISDTNYKYELRIVVWRIKNMADKKKNVKVRVFLAENQKNVLFTDTHKNAMDSAEFNWRMKFLIDLPCKDSKVVIEMLENEENGPFGFLSLDMEDFFKDVHKSINKERLLPTWIEFFDEFGNVAGKILLEMSILLDDDAQENPVGLGRSEPNREPPLHPPKYGRDLIDLEEEITKVKQEKITGKNKYRKYIALMFCIIILVSIPIIVVSV